MDADENPFAPESKRPTAGWLLGVLLFAFLKLPLLLLLLSLGFIYTILGSLFPVRALRRVITRIYSRVIFQAILFLTGVWSVHRQPTPLVDTYSDPQEIDDPGPGDVILANCASHLNVFWLQCHYAPVLAVPVDPDHVVVKSALQLFFQILAAADPAPEGGSRSLMLSPPPARALSAQSRCSPRRPLQTGAV
jgi:hypothetical protein